jgi:hypothetical protein
MGVLPRRNSTRARPAGRHRSPDRLSVPSAAPAIVLAVPGADCDASAQIADGIAATVAALCPGVEIHAGYAGGPADGPGALGPLLGAVVAARAAASAGDTEGVAAECPYAAVVVPLRISPDADSDAAIDQAVAAAGPAAARTDCLGPHPLLAGGLHDRLAGAGLVQGRRISGLSLVTLEVGVLVGAVGGDRAVQAAETAAVMLTARLGVPVAPVSLTDPASLEYGVARLHQGGARRLALAPYVVGPEISANALAAAATAARAQCAPALGEHAAVGQLVTMRYGAALLGQGSQAPPGLPGLRRLDQLA